MTLEQAINDLLRATDKYYEWCCDRRMSRHEFDELEQARILARNAIIESKRQSCPTS